MARGLSLTNLHLAGFWLWLTCIPGLVHPHIRHRRNLQRSRNRLVARRSWARTNTRTKWPNPSDLLGEKEYHYFAVGQKIGAQKNGTGRMETWNRSPGGSILTHTHISIISRRAQRRRRRRRRKNAIYGPQQTFEGKRTTKATTTGSSSHPQVSFWENRWNNTHLNQTLLFWTTLTQKGHLCSHPVLGDFQLLVEGCHSLRRPQSRRPDLRCCKRSQKTGAEGGGG